MAELYTVQLVKMLIPGLQCVVETLYQFATKYVASAKNAAPVGAARNMQTSRRSDDALAKAGERSARTEDQFDGGRTGNSGLTRATAALTIAAPSSTSSVLSAIIRLTATA